MIKGLKEQIEITERKIKQLEDKMTPDTHFSLIDKLELEYCKNNLKYLKALEIIKKKQVSIWRFRNIVFGYEQKQNGNFVNDTYEYYKEHFGYYHEGFEFELLTEEEFNTLKECLK